MNDTVSSFANQTLKSGLLKCTDGQQHLFKRMYSHNDLTLDLDAIVDNMSDDQIDRALSQVERTIAHNNS